METIWSKKADAVLSAGRWLGDIGDYNWALTRKEALKALDQLEIEQIGVLGGSVLEMREGIFYYNYDNWSCNPQADESDAAFAKRSIIETRTYITNYRSNQVKQYFFEIIPETKKREKQKPKSR